MAMYLTSVTVSPGFTSVPTLKPACFSFSIRIGLAKSLFIVLEEPVGHGIAYLRILPPGLRPQIGAIAGGAGTQDIPYLFIRMPDRVRGVSVKDRHE